MTKRQLIDEIMTVNRTAQPGFLARFEEADLDEYLRHLLQARTRRISGDSSRYGKFFRTESPRDLGKTPMKLVTAECAVAVLDIPAYASPATEPAGAAASIVIPTAAVVPSAPQVLVPATPTAVAPVATPLPAAGKADKEIEKAVSPIVSQPPAAPVWTEADDVQCDADAEPIADDCDSQVADDSDETFENAPIQAALHLPSDRDQQALEHAAVAVGEGPGESPPPLSDAKKWLF